MKLARLILTNIDNEMEMLRRGLLHGQSSHDEYLRICGMYKGLQMATDVVQRLVEKGSHENDLADELDETFDEAHQPVVQA